ncbi:MAG: metallophosphoesterase [Eubacteriaceae bacterium]|nr:metallophosphoesterase [Eubacteriaceae bacterium]
MKIYVLSDCHEDDTTLHVLFQKAGKVDFVIFLGDGIATFKQALLPYHLPYAAVKGNNDRGAQEPFDKVLTLKGRRFFLTHGHQYNVGTEKNALAAKAKEVGCETAFFGHTHMPFYKEVDGIMLINPGSTFYGRRGSKKSYGVLCLEEKDMSFQFCTL